MKIASEKILFTFVFFAVLQIAVCRNRLYVRARDQNECPGDIPPDHCQTLDWYSQHVNTSFVSDTTMVFLKGHHVLNSFIEVNKCNNFTMTGPESSVYDTQGLPLPVSWINCNGSFETGIIFTNSSDIQIYNLGFSSCGGRASFYDNFSLYVAVSFYRVNNLALDRVFIDNTTGFGLHCNNVYGHINVTSSVFRGAKGDNRNIYSGNAEFWFGDFCPDNGLCTTLSISHSWFLFGKATYKSNYSASGLKLLILCPGIHATLNNITAYGNKGKTGGNLAISITDFGHHKVSSVTIMNSNISNGMATKGGGLRLWSEINKNDNKVVNDDGEVEYQLMGTLKPRMILTIINTTFDNNHAYEIGGAVYIAHYEASSEASSVHAKLSMTEITIINCTFTGNSGNGAAMEILKQTLPGYIPHMTPQLTVHLKHCSFHNNSVPPDKHSGIIELIGTKNIKIDNCNFTDSLGSVFSLRRGNLNFFGHIRFENNHALHGAALKICDSSIVYLHNGTFVLFKNNTAHKGGAVYAEQGCLDTAPACVFQPAVNESVPIEDFKDIMTLAFVNNSAILVGDAVYGGSIDFCYTLKPFSFNGTKGSFNNYIHIFDEIFDTTGQKGISTITSDPRGVCFCDFVNEDKLQAVCNNSSVANNIITLYPGQKFTVSLSTVGQFNELSIGAIGSSLNSTNPSHDLISMNSTIAHKGCVNLTYRVLSNETNKSDMIAINFAITSTNVNAYYNTTDTSLLLSLQPCPLGFQLSLDKKLCTCDWSLAGDMATPGSIQCEIDTQIIIIPAAKSNRWIGVETINATNEGEHSFFIMNYQCHDYCRSDVPRRVNLSNETSIDNQCLLGSGRTGIICSKCKAGLSRVLGNFRVCRQCSNRNLIFLIPIFLLSGIFIVFLLQILNLTVTGGTTTAIVVYANVMYSYQASIPYHHFNIYDTMCQNFVSLLNLDIGFELCFYNGMDEYQQIWLTYGYVFYMIGLMITIVILCRNFTSFTRLFGRNIVKVMATLIFLILSPLIHAIIQTFHCTYLRTSWSIGKWTKVWYFDGSVPCYGSKHMPLFIAGVICLVVTFVFAFSLLLVQCLQRRANIFCLRWVNKMRPFYEAYTGPCRDNYRFWPGFLLLMRIIMCVTSKRSYYNVPFTYTMTATLCAIILSLSCTFPRGIYKMWPLNMLEFSFFLNLLITSALLADSSLNSRLIINTSVTIAMIEFAFIITYHLVSRIRPKVSQRLKAKLHLKKFSKKCSNKCKSCTSWHCCLSRGQEESDSEREALLPQPLPRVINYEHYREPLIGNTND